MRWLKVVVLRFLNLEKRERRRGRVQIRRYSKWRGDRYRWMRIVNIMDVWEKRREHVEGQGDDERQEKQKRERLGGNSVGATGTVNVGTGAANVNIGCTAASAIVIGNAGGTTIINGPLTSNGLITANGGLTIGGSNNITVGNGSVGPSSNAQIGFRSNILFQVSGANGSATPGMVTNITTFNVPPGNYLCELSMNVTFPTTGYECYISSVSGVADFSRVFGGLAPSSNVTIRMTCFINNPSATSTTFYLTGKSNQASQSYGFIYLYLTRIS